MRVVAGEGSRADGGSGFYGYGFAVKGREEAVALKGFRGGGGDVGGQLLGARSRGTFDDASSDGRRGGGKAAPTEHLGRNLGGILTTLWEKVS